MSAAGGNLTLVRALLAANRAGRGDPAVHVQPGAGVRAEQDACVFRDNRAPPPPPGPAPPYPAYAGLPADAPPV